MSSAQNREANGSINTTKNYKQALLRYEYAIWKGAHGDDRNRLLLKKALCFRDLNDFEEAIKSLNRTRLSKCNDSLRAEIIYNKAFFNYAIKNYTESLTFLKQLNHSKAFQNYLHRYYVLKSINENSLRRWNEAHASLNEYLQYLEERHHYIPPLQVAIDSIYSKKNIPKLKNKRKAFILSFLPGAGMIYSGKPIKGIINFTLCSVSLGFGAYHIFNELYLTGYFGGGILLEKFYFGGRRHTDYLIDYQNNKLSENFNSSTNRFILNLNKELKKAL